MYKRIRDSPIQDDTQRHLNDFSKEGLRTLVIGYRELSEAEYTEWNQEYHYAIQQIHNRDELVNAAADRIETNFILLGCTAIEDKLQVGVPETIDYLIQVITSFPLFFEKDFLTLKAGIKIYVITGDKQETAINIGYSTNLLKPDQHLVIIKNPTSTKPLQECKKYFEEAIADSEV